MKRNFADDFSAKTEVNERMKTNIAAGALVNSRISKSQMWQTANVRPLTATRGLPIVARSPNLDFEVYNVNGSSLVPETRLLW